MLELIFVNISKRPCKLLIYMDRESDFQSVGREFESRRTHQQTRGSRAIVKVARLLFYSYFGNRGQPRDCRLETFERS